MSSMDVPRWLLRMGVPILGGAFLMGCSASGLSEAREACSIPAVESSAGFNPDAEPISQLVAGAKVAQQRAELANEAANVNGRWSVLSEASNALVAFADLLVETRMDGLPVSDVTTPEMWDQAKFASDAFLAECKAALQ
jgi:hypothetical protein